MADISKRDQNRVTSLLAISNVDGLSTVTLYADPSTHELLIQGTLTVTGGATSTKQSDGSQKTQVVDGSGNVIGATSNALDVNIKSGSSSGEQYADNTAVSAAYKGNLILGTDGSNYQVLSVNSDGVVQVDLNSANVTNAGTFDVQATLADETTKVIGTVNVTNGSLNGPGIPVIDSYTHVAITTATNTADQALVAAPGANKQIWVYGISYVVGTAAGTVSFQDSDNTAISGVMAHALNSGLAISPSGNFAMPVWKVVTNKALEVDTVTCDIEGWLSYAIVSV